MFAKLTQQVKSSLSASAKLATTILLMPFSRKHRFKLGETYNLLKNPFHGPERVELSELLSNEQLDIKLASVKSNIHNTTEFELLAITAILKDKNCNTIFEIGTYDGRTTRAMAMNLAGNNGKVYTINLPPATQTVALSTDQVDVALASKLVSGEKFIGTPEEEMIEQLWGDSATFDFSPYHHTMDLVFIDGAHSQFYVQNDTAKAIQMLKPGGGWIIWHDAPYFGVAKFLKEWIAQGNNPVYFIKHTSLAVAFVKEEKIISFPG